MNTANPKLEQSKSPADESEVKASTPGLSGWVRVDTDNVMRGWVTDRNDRNRRCDVEIFIDDRKVAELRSDALDPKLVELGEHDGRYAFAYVIPAAYRDDRPHGFVVRTKNSDHRLRSKLEAFTIAADRSTPRLEVAGYTLSGVRGWVHGGQYAKSISLSLHDGEARLDPPLDTQWSTTAAGLEFHAALTPEDRRILAERPLMIAAPGMVEAGLPVGRLEPYDLQFTARVDAGGLVSVRLAGDLRPLEAETLELWFSRRGEGSIVQVQTATVESGRMTARLPDTLVAADLSVRLGYRGAALPFEPTDLLRDPGVLVENGNFQGWTGDGPAGWTVGATPTRGFHAFPEAITLLHGLSGDMVSFGPLSVGGVILRRLLRADPPTGVSLPLVLAARSSEPVDLVLRLIDADGRSLGELAVSTLPSWAWTFATGEVRLSPGELSPIAIELAAPNGLAAELDVARIQLGAADAESRGRPEEVAPDPGNHVHNAGLVHWPAGIVFDGVRGRRELAEGWYVENSRAATPVRARAVFGELETDGPALAWAASEVPEHCRLEIRLNQDIAAMGEGVIAFTLGMPSVARRLFQSGEAALPEHILMDRVRIIRRTAFSSHQGVRLTETILATAARRLLVIRQDYRFDLRFVVGPTEEPSEEAVLSTEDFLSLEFRQPFAAAIRDVCVSAGTTPRPEEGGHLALEDRSILAQLAQVHGLDAWTSPEVQVARPPSPLEPGLAWRWTAARSETVEVVVCVHNAIDETLDCLVSMIGTTTVPHLLHIVDDASDRTGAALIDDFARGKPWVRVTRNPANLGYTASADLALRGSEADWVVLLNSDTIVTRGWLEGLLSCAGSDPKIGLVGPLSNAASFQSVPDLYDAQNQWKTNGLPPGASPQDVADVVRQASVRSYPDVPLLNGFCTLIRRQAYLELGGLNVAAFPRGYGEENDLCLRAGKAGWRLVVADDVYVYHVKSASFGQQNWSAAMKQGTATLRTLHPDVDLAALTSRYRDIPALSAVRDAVRRAYDAAL